MNKKGSALPLALILSTILLTLGLSYAKLTIQTNTPTQKIDEKVRLQYLSDGIAQIALLKFQKFPSEFYAAWEAANAPKNADKDPLDVFCGSKAEEFKSSSFDNTDDQIVAFNSSRATDGSAINVDAGNDKIDINLIEYKLLNTDSNNKITGKWDTGIITIKTRAVYQDVTKNNVMAESIITYQATRTRL